MAFKVDVGATGLDTNVTVRLTDVDAQGDRLGIAVGAARLLLRDSYSVPASVTQGQRYTLNVPFTSDLTYTFAAGHRVGLILAGSNYPLFAINPHTGANSYQAGDTETTVTNTFYLDGSATLTLTGESP